MTRAFIVFLTVGVVGHAEAQTLEAAALVPPGTVEVGRAVGDLNGDGVADVALLVHLSSTPDAGQTTDWPQQVLLFVSTAKGTFTLWKKGTTHFVEAHPNLMTPGGLRSMTIENGVLTLSTDIAMSMGGWSAGGCTMKWRNEKVGLRLIGLTRSNIDRRCACGTELDTNLVTGVTIVKSDEEGQPPRVTKKGKSRTQLWEAFDYSRECSQ